MFTEERIIQGTKSKSFWDREKRIKVKTFADSKKAVAVVGTEKITVESEVLFRRLFAITKDRH